MNKLNTILISMVIGILIVVGLITILSNTFTGMFITMLCTVVSIYLLQVLFNGTFNIKTIIINMFN